jgi:hypothetical protein
MLHPSVGELTFGFLKERELNKIKLLELPGEDFLFVPLKESDSDVVPMESIIPQNQIEALLDPDKIPELELLTGELALGLRRHMLQEQIAFHEDRENLERAIRRSLEFPGISHSRKEIETEWQDA